MLETIIKLSSLRRYPQFAGGVIASYGILIIVSWHAHWRPILQLIPTSAPMQYNSALSFLLLGGGLCLLHTRWARWVPWMAALVVILTGLTLGEYATGRDFNVDQIFHTPYFQYERIYAGRMSPLAAACFILSGLGLMMARPRKEGRQRLLAAMIGCIVEVIAVVALLGFLFGIQAAYGWGAYAGMALNTAILFSFYGAALLMWAWETSERENVDFERWLPGTAAVTLMIMIGFVSVVNNQELKKATYWREHTLEVIFTGHALTENLIDLQSAVRSYVSTGDKKAYRTYLDSLTLQPQLFNRVTDLTKDNPAQQKYLKDLYAAMQRVFDYDRRVIAVYETEGGDGVIRMDATGERRIVFADARGALKEFIQGEQQLLETRGAVERANAHKIAQLLLFGSGLAAVLLVLANIMVGVEMKRRRKIEREREKLIAELQQALADVKTLSGMIPICGWCKSIRSDKGYWESVEQFVQSKSTATFSHGICPECYEKVKTEMNR